MERVFEAFAAVKGMPNGEWVAEAHMNGTVCARRMAARNDAVEWANARVRAQARYWEEVQRDKFPGAAEYNSGGDINGAPISIRLRVQSSSNAIGAVVLYGYNGCFAMFACRAYALRCPRYAAMRRAAEWLQHGK